MTTKPTAVVLPTPTQLSGTFVSNSEQDDEIGKLKKTTHNSGESQAAAQRSLVSLKSV